MVFMCFFCFPTVSAFFFLRRLLYGAACGLKHMHSFGKVHRDVKAGNIIIIGGPAERTLKAKIADFGLTCGEQKI